MTSAIAYLYMRARARGAAAQRDKGGFLLTGRHEHTLTFLIKHGAGACRRALVCAARSVRSEFSGRVCTQRSYGGEQRIASAAINPGPRRAMRQFANVSRSRGLPAGRRAIGPL